MLVTDLLTFSAASKHVIGPTGTLDLVAANRPAFDWSSGRRRLLIEAAGANYAQYGQSPGVAWTQIGSPTIATGIDDPAGGTTATRLTLASGQGVYRTANGYTPSSRMEAPIYIRPVSTSGGVAIRNPEDGSLGYWHLDLSALPRGVYSRITRSHSAVNVISNFQTTASGGIGYWLNSDGGAPVFDAWCAELQPGTVVSSPMPTTGSATFIRTADDVRLSAAALAAMQSAGGCTIALRGYVPPGAAPVVLGVNSAGWLHDLYSGGASIRGVLVPNVSGLAAGFGAVIRGNAAGTDGAINGVMASAKGAADSPITAVRLGALVDGVYASTQLYLDELLIWPFVGSDAGILSQARVWA